MRELDPIDHLTADAIGPAGERVFYIQAREMGEAPVTVIAEKQQVQLLASSVLEVLSRVDRETEAIQADMDLLEPIDPLWRAGRLSLGYEDSRDIVVLEIEELVPEDEDGTQLTEPDRLQISASREQVLALATHGAEVCERGRPLCELCGNPLEEGHACPATNGHKTPNTLA